MIHDHPPLASEPSTKTWQAHFDDLSEHHFYTKRFIVALKYEDEGSSQLPGLTSVRILKQLSGKSLNVQ
jgi:hypothetical protein